MELTYTTQGGNCGAKSNTLGINIIPIPKIIDISPNVEVCTSQKTIKLSASTNIGGKINWYAYPGTFDKPQVARGAEVVFTFDSYSQVLGNSIELKAETDYNYACGYTAKYVLVKFVGSGATTSTNSYVCYADTAVALSSTISGTATGGIWSSSGVGVFSPNAASLNTTYKITEQDRLNGNINFTFTTTGDSKCVVTKTNKVEIKPGFTQPDPEPVPAHCGAFALSIKLDSATGVKNPQYQWQYSSDLKGWSSVTPTGLNLESLKVPENVNLYVRRVAKNVSFGCSIATKPILVKTAAPVLNNTVTGSQTVCYGDLPSSFTGSVPTGGLAAGHFYQWQVSSTGDSLDFVTLPAKIERDMRADISPNSEYFRRVVLSKSPDICPHSVSNIVTITVQKCPGINIILPKMEFCEGDEFVVEYSSTGVSFPAGNVFTVQASTSSSFNNSPYPVTLGTLASSATSGKIACKFVVPSTGAYLCLRVVASDPSVKSYIAYNILYRTVRTGFTLNGKKVATGTQVILTNKVADFESGSWDFGSGAVYETPVSLLNPTLTYPTVGTRTITLMATTKYGCSKTFSNQISVVDYKCDSKPSARTFILTDSTTGTLPNNSSAWVKPGATYTHTAGNNDTIYVSSGGTLFLSKNVTGLVIYLESNAYYGSNLSSVSGTLVYNTGAVWSNNVTNTILCDKINFSGDVVTGIHEKDGSETVACIYPNPAIEGKFTVKAPDDIKEVTIVNSLGVKETHYGTQIETQMRGLLIVTIKTENNVYTRKVTVIE